MIYEDVRFYFPDPEVWSKVQIFKFVDMFKQDLETMNFKQCYINGIKAENGGELFKPKPRKDRFDFPKEPGRQISQQEIEASSPMKMSKEQRIAAMNRLVSSP